MTRRRRTARPHERLAINQRNAAKPRLRFDKVATRLIERLRANLDEAVPDGMAVVLTITAPIRVASKTAASLEDKIRTLLARRSPGRDEKGTIHGNRVWIRLLRDKSERAPKLIGFVHNADSDPVLLLNMTSELLVMINARDSSCSEAYRYICSQLRMANDFKKILMVFGDGRVASIDRPSR
jgi:hypothetical protein